MAGTKRDKAPGKPVKVGANPVFAPLNPVLTPGKLASVPPKPWKTKQAGKHQGLACRQREARTPEPEMASRFRLPRRHSPLPSRDKAMNRSDLSDRNPGRAAIPQP